MKRQRRSGPGGQHRNKVETAVVIVHQPSGIRGEASERRSQAENLKMAVQRLRVKLAIGVRAADLNPVAFAPSDLWQSRLRGQQISVSLQHDDFPALLAEALDLLAACEFDHKQAAERLGCSPSQLVKFLKVESEAWILVNKERAARKLAPLR